MLLKTPGIKVVVDLKMLYLRISRRLEREFNAEQQASVTIPRCGSMPSSQQSYFIVVQLVVVASSQQSYVFRCYGFEPVGVAIAYCARTIHIT